MLCDIYTLNELVPHVVICGVRAREDGGLGWDGDVHLHTHMYMRFGGFALRVCVCVRMIYSLVQAPGVQI